MTGNHPTPMAPSPIVRQAGLNARWQALGVLELAM